MVGSMFRILLTEPGIQTGDAECKLMRKMFIFDNLVLVIKVIFVDHLCWLCFTFHVCLCCAVLSVPCRPVIASWERTDFFALLFAMFPCVFVTFPYGDLGQVCYLIESIHYLCLFLYFYDPTCYLMSFFLKIGNMIKYKADMSLKNNTMMLHAKYYETIFRHFLTRHYEILLVVPGEK